MSITTVRLDPAERLRPSEGAIRAFLATMFADCARPGNAGTTRSSGFETGTCRRRRLHLRLSAATASRCRRRSGFSAA